MAEPYSGCGYRNPETAERVDRYKGDVKENEMKKLQVVLGKTTLLACVLAVMAGGCSKDKSSDKGGHEDGGVAGESDVGGNAGSGGDSGGESSSGGKSSAGGTSSATSASENGGGAAGSSGTGGATAGITALSVKAEQTSLRGLVEQTLTLDVTIEREGSSEGEVSVSTQGLPAGIGSSPAKIVTGSNKAQLQIKIGPTAQVGGPYAFSVVATSADDSSVSTKTPMVLYVAQTAGTLDISFGSAGTAEVTPVQGGEGTATGVYPSSIAVDSKGRVVVGGDVDSKGWVVRLTPNGTLDTTFANTGALNNFGLPYSWVHDVAFSNEQLYVSAEQYSSSSPNSQYLRKIAESGTTDPAYNIGLDVMLTSDPLSLAAFKGGVLAARPLTLIGANGVVDTSFSAPTDVRASVLAVDSQERVLYAGTLNNTSFSIGRLLSNGEADSSFGTNGSVTSPCPTDGERTFANSANAVFVMPNQSVVALVNCSASLRNPYGWQAALVAFSPTGQLVHGFGDNGRSVVTDPGNGYGAIVQPDGNVIVFYSKDAKAADEEMYDYVLSRYDSTGAKDTSFGESGIVKLGSRRSIGLSPIMAYDASVQRVVVALPVSDSTAFEIKRVWL
jgi:uncharacterized delta-60 repeat protein